MVKNQATEGNIVLADVCTCSSHSQAQNSDGDEEAMSRTRTDGIMNVDDNLDCCAAGAVRGGGGDGGES